MPNDSQNTHSQVSPHPDGKREGVINDSKGSQMGVTTDTKRSFKGREKELNLQPDEKMREFKENMENVMDDDS
ncbi:hypothetical protein [Halobacillus sp. Marseille-Q1614]|uniref:hypothetical protein n=1 Tax=Halobacillus sp. Marseille-Q1614 TaxID=2709134 RepID=UPI00156DB496|nr:hypothetical protein [Halobacillus sp. Marseille-Q1614]